MEMLNFYDENNVKFIIDNLTNKIIEIKNKIEDVNNYRKEEFDKVKDIYENIKFERNKIKKELEENLENNYQVLKKILEDTNYSYVNKNIIVANITNYKPNTKVILEMILSGLLPEQIVSFDMKLLQKLHKLSPDRNMLIECPDKQIRIKGE